MINFIRSYQSIFQSGFTFLYLRQQCMRGSGALHSVLEPIIVQVCMYFFILAVIRGIEKHVVLLMCISLKPNDVGQHFMCLMNEVYCPFSEYFFFFYIFEIIIDSQKSQNGTERFIV